MVLKLLLAPFGVLVVRPPRAGRMLKGRWNQLHAGAAAPVQLRPGTAASGTGLRVGGRSARPTAAQLPLCSRDGPLPSPLTSRPWGARPQRPRTGALERAGVGWPVQHGDGPPRLQRPRWQGSRLCPVPVHPGARTWTPQALCSGLRPGPQNGPSDHLVYQGEPSIWHREQTLDAFAPSGSHVRRDQAQLLVWPTSSLECDAPTPVSGPSLAFVTQLCSYSVLEGAVWAITE